MFDGSSINTLNITSFNTDKVSDMSAMFAETPLAEIDLMFGKEIADLVMEKDKLYRRIQTGINSEEMIKKYNAIGLQLTLKLADYKLYGKPKGYDIENGYVYLDDGTDDDFY